MNDYRNNKITMIMHIDTHRPELEQQPRTDEELDQLINLHLGAAARYRLQGDEEMEEAAHGRAAELRLEMAVRKADRKGATA